MDHIEQTQLLLQKYRSGESISFVDLALCMHSMSSNHIYDPCSVIALDVLIDNLANLNKKEYIWIEDVLNKAININSYISDLNFDDGNDYVITNAYYNESCSGVGDFIRGCCYMHKIFKNTNISLEIDFENHYLGKYVKSSTPKFREEIFDTEKHNKDLCSPKIYFANMMINIKNALKVLKEKKKINILSNFSDYVSLDANSRPKYSLEEDQILFMKQNMIFSEDVMDYVKRLNIKKFTLIHFRLGDREMLNDENLDENNINTKKYNVSYKECINKIDEIAKNTKNQIVVISDSNKLKEYLKDNKRIICPHLKSDHCSHNPGYVKDYNIDHQKKKEAMFYVAVDMYLSSIAENIYSYSVYPWGSGFVFWIAKIFNIPISTHII